MELFDHTLLEVVTRFRRSGVELCRYDVQVKDYANSSFFPNSNIGPCPVLPVYPT